MPSYEFYKQRELQFKQEGEHIENKIRQYSWSRVALVLVMAVLIYAGLFSNLFFLATDFTVGCLCAPGQSPVVIQKNKNSALLSWSSSISRKESVFDLNQLIFLMAVALLILIIPMATILICLDPVLCFNTSTAVALN